MLEILTSASFAKLAIVHFKNACAARTWAPVISIFITPLRTENSTQYQYTLLRHVAIQIIDIGPVPIIFVATAASCPAESERANMINLARCTFNYRLPGAFFSNARAYLEISPERHRYEAAVAAFAMEA